MNDKTSLDEVWLMDQSEFCLRWAHPRALIWKVMTAVASLIILPDSMARSPRLKEDQIYWVRDQLIGEVWGEDALVSAFVADFRQRLAVATKAADVFDRIPIEAESFTIHNPAFWRAAFAMGDDRVLLFWLHALLLAEEGRTAEAFEWAVLARRSVLLSEPFDQRWLEWEKALLTRSPVGEYYRTNPRSATYLLRDQFDSIFGRIQRGLSQYTPEVPLGFVLEPVDLDSPADQAHQQLVWNRQRRQLAEGKLPANVREIIINRQMAWPVYPGLAADELAIMSVWWIHENETALGLMAWLNAVSRLPDPPPFLYESYLSPLISAQFAGDFTTVSTAPSRLGLVISWSDYSEKSQMVHPSLRFDALQTTRRLELYRSSLERWRLDDEWFHGTLAEAYSYSEDERSMTRSLKKIQWSRVGREMGDLEYLRRASWGTENDSLDRVLKRTIKTNRKTLKRPYLYILACIELADWTAASEALLSVAEEEKTRADYFNFHAAVAGSLAGRLPSEIIDSDLIPSEPSTWGQRLCAVLIRPPDRDDFLKSARAYTEFGTAGNLAEAHLALAFAPGATPESRRADLQSIIETGRVDLIANTMAHRVMRGETAPARSR